MEEIVEIIRVNGVEYSTQRFKAQVIKRNDGNEYIREMLGFKKVERLNGVPTIISDKKSSMF